MAFSQTGRIDDINIVEFLKIYQMNGFTRNLSDNSDMWAHFSKLKEMDPTARYLKYLLVDELGYGAVQALAADGTGAYPAARRSGLQEASARYKEWGWTVDVPRVLENKTGSELMQYAKPLATELDNKQIAFARLKCIELQGDGTGVIGVINGTPTDGGNTLDCVISKTTGNAGRSFIRWFQEGDLVRIYTTAGTAHNDYDTATTASYWKVEDIVEETDTVKLRPYNSSDVAQTTTANFNAADGDVIYRLGTTAQDLTALSGNEYEDISEVMVGLESLLADDGRKVHGLTRSGAIKGTRRDLSGVAIDSKHFQAALSRLKVAAGKGRYKYPSAFMSDLVYDALVEARETDRRFHSIEDSDRGVKGIGYVHGKDRVEFMPDEFVHPQRIWILPEGKEALCYVGRDPQQVAPNGNDPFHLSTSSSGSGYGRDMQTFFEQTGVLLSKHPAACGVIENFTSTDI